jgi:HSP20 family protein
MLIKGKIMNYKHFEQILNENNLNNFTNLFENIFKENKFSPKIDISENTENYFVDVEISGIEKKDVKITLKDNTLRIEGEKKNFRNENTLTNSERLFGIFNREFELPENVDKSNIQAEFTNGILTISLNKLKSEQKNEINIKIN